MQQRFMYSVILLPLMVALLVKLFVLFIIRLSTVFPYKIRSLQIILGSSLSWQSPLLILKCLRLGSCSIAICAWQCPQRDLPSTFSLPTFDRHVLFELSFDQFILTLVVGYFIRLLLMILLANYYYPIRIRFHFPSNTRSILIYSATILLAAFAGSLIIDIDKFMIPQLQEIQQTAFYAIAIFAATLVEVPARAMQQILNPLVATAVNENNAKEVNNLYKKSALNLVVVSGLVFLVSESQQRSLILFFA